MKRNKKSESIAEELLFIKNSLTILSDDSSENKEEILAKSTEKFNNIAEFFNGVRKLIFFLLTTVIVLVILLLVSLYYAEKAKNINSEIQDVITDTIANQILEVKRVMKSDSTYETTYSYRTRNNKIVTYNQVLKEVDSLEKVILNRDLKIRLLQNEVSDANDKIELAEENYNLRFWKSYQIENNKKVEYTNIESKKLDSALILLEVYRNKLNYNKDTKKWEIK